MAKRIPVSEAPYNPIDSLLTKSVILGPSIVHESKMQESEGDGRGILPEVRGGPHKALATRGVSTARISAPLEPEGTERRCREKRLMLSRREERNIERLVDRMADELRTTVKLSNVLRAAVSVLLHAEEELIRKLESIKSLERPANSDAVALAQFEHQLAMALSQALRDAPPLRWPVEGSAVKA